MSPDRAHSAGADTQSARPWTERLSELFLSADPRRQIRITQWGITQWGITAIVYAASALAVKFALRPGSEEEIGYASWCAFLAVFLTGIYVALRSGWSERFTDPALTATQMVLGSIGVEWAYVLCGPARGMTLYALLLIFAFGAFSLSWRRIMWLTLLTLTSLIAVVTVLELSRSGDSGSPLKSSELRLDQANMLMIIIVLPALSVIAARLSMLRSRLRSQRSALSEAMEQVQRLATHDHLTGLVNRRYLQQRLTQEQSRFQRHGDPFSLAIIDLDFFKRINDTQGHAFGDQVLQAFAAEAVATVRASDLMARWGGEEFLVLLPDTRAAQAATIIQRLLTRMPAIPHANGPPLTFSAGVTECHRDETVEDTVARADAAMYEAKASGRNAVRLKQTAT